jgi:putative ABC transport system substrate-binding protein
VFVQVEDPIGSGFVSSLARPGGNITGFTHFDYAMGGKWLEMLKEIAPNFMRVAILQTLGNPSWPGYLRAIEAAAPALRVQLVPVRVRDAAEIERAIDVFARESNGGMIMLPDITAASHRALVIALAARYRLPAIYSYRFFVTAGGLMSYAPNNIDQYPRAASYIDRILRGEKAGELPIQRPTKFELVINLKTAKALGLTIPKSLLISVDEMIE